ncbi:lipoprotein [Candidatus Peregrinibacteria bacterium]|nr:lipoprotein [Candidatus Peregrinibacteria bacterium]
MKKLILLILATLILSACSLKPPAPYEDGEITDNELLLTQYDCPAMLDGSIEETKTSRGIGHETGTVHPEKEFIYEDSNGIRCFYYQEHGDEYDIMHAEGDNYGEYTYFYGMEVRLFNTEEAMQDYENNIADLIANTYCRDDNGGVRTKLGVIIGLGDFPNVDTTRYQCSWPEQGNISNANNLLNVTRYRNGIVTLYITRELGRSYYVPPNYEGSQEYQKERNIRARATYVYNDPSFQATPDEYEAELMNDLLYLVDKVQSLIEQQQMMVAPLDLTN